MSEVIGIEKFNLTETKALADYTLQSIRETEQELKEVIDRKERLSNVYNALIAVIDQHSLLAELQQQKEVQNNG